MKTFISALALIGAVNAHATVWSVSINGVDQGNGNTQGGYIDTPPSNSPVTDVTSKNMECNVPGIKATKSLSAKPGDEIAVQWYHEGPRAGDQIIDPSHKGPTAVYVSKAGSPMSWTKIAEDGYDGKAWGVERMRTGAVNGKKGQQVFKIPNGLAPGDYVFRPEIIALHEGNRVGGAQFYMECIHMKIGGSGTTALPAGVAIPGYVTANTPGVLFDIYNPFSSYPVPGPKVWTGGASSPSTGGGSSNDTTAESGAGSPDGSSSPSSPAADAPSSGAPSSGAPSSGGSTSGGSTSDAPSSGAPSSDAPTTGAPASGGSEECDNGTGNEPTESSTEPGNGATQPGNGATQPGNGTAPAAPASGGAVAEKWYQCGGQGYTGPTACASGTQCVKQNDYYHQCI